MLLALVIGTVCLVLHGANQSDADTVESQTSSREISYTDFDGKRFGIKTGSSFESATLQYFPNAEYFYFDSSSDMIVALNSNKIDAYLEDEPVARMMHNTNSDIDYIREPIVNDDYCFAFNKSQRAEKLRDEFNEYLDEIQANGISDALLEKWFSADEAAKTIDRTGLTGENGSIQVVVIPDIVPFSYIANNELQGYGVEIMLDFGRKYGYDVQFEQANVAASLAGIATEKYDVLADCVSVTEERKETMNFSDVVYNGGIMLMARASDLSHTGQAVSELTYTAYNGKKIGILTGTNMEAESFKYFPDSEYFYYDGYPNLNTALLNGTIDAYLGDEPALKSIHAEQPKIDYIKERLTNNQYSFAFRKDEESETKLRDQLNAFLQKSYADGTIAEMDAVWFGVDDSKKVVDMSGLTGENGAIHVVTTSTDEPFSYIKDGKHVGYDIDVVVRFCREYGYALEIGDVDFQARIPALASGKYEFTTSMNVTPEREEEVMFSDPVSTGGIVVAVRAEDLADTAANASVEERPLSYYYERGSTFGAISGGLYEVKLLERFPDAKVLQFNNQPDMAVAVSSGIIDAFTCPRSSAEDFMKADPTLTCLNEVFMEIPYGFAFQKSKEQEHLRDEMNAFLQKLHDDGTYDEIVATWFGEDESVKHVDYSGLTGKNGTIRYITASTMQPFSYIENGKNAGIEVDLVTRFCTEYGYDLKIDNGEFASLIPGITSGTYDIASGTIMITPERAESVNFSDVYYTADAVAVVRKEAAARTDDVEVEKTSWLDSIRNSFEKNFIRESRWKLIVEGIGTTCIITVLTVIFGSVLAFLICLFRRTDSILAGKIADMYVKLLQGTPMVVLLMILYYVIFGKSGMPAVWVAVIGFSLNFAAYTSETLRSGINGIDGGQREAALALGYSESQAFFRFIFPQAAVRQLPVYRGEIISLLKNTSIVGYIAIQDLTKMSDIIRSRTYEAFFPLIVTAVIYFILAWIISLILKAVLKQIDPRERKRTVKGVTVK